MKKLLIYISFATLLLQGCTKNFDTINADPKNTTADQFNPNYLLSSAQYAYASQGYNYFMFQPFWVQTLASTSTLISDYLSNGDKYVATGGTSGYLSGIWNTDYGSTDKFGTGAGNLVAEAINLSASDPTKTNLVAICKIVKVMALQQITDVYGDIPYTQALQGKTGVTHPVYDTQKEIYDSIFVNLQDAIAMFDASKPVASSDLFYAGDITKWKKFGYSLMLRAAMRLTKVDPVTAKLWAEKAVLGGVFTSNADNAIVKPELSTSHGNSQAGVYGTDLYETRWSKTMIDYLKFYSDPRLGVVAEVPDTGLANNKLIALGDRTAANQLGLPNGYNLTNNANSVKHAPNFVDSTGTGSNTTLIGKYSRPTASAYTNQSSPIIVLTYSEIEFLQAEAVVRGWTVSGAAAVHYANGVTAGMSSLTTISDLLTVPSGDIANYLIAHPLSAIADTALKQINMQIWATTGTTFEFMESWINWRRSGYPVLVPVNFIGNFSNGTVPRRQIYPSGEATLNGVNYQAAVGRLSGGDAWTSRVWWDVAQ